MEKNSIGGVMKVYNEEKTQILTEYDLTVGELIESTITVTTPEIEGVEEIGHYEILQEYPNGGKDVKWVVDVEGIEYQPAQTYEETILVYVKYTNEALEQRLLESLRMQREEECFSVINRGQLWYNTLDNIQLEELRCWYEEWLDVTETRVIPTKPTWIK